MNKRELAVAVADRIGYYISDAEEVVDTILESIKSRLEEGEDVTICNFGKFYLKDKSSRLGRNVVTGEEVEISSRRVVKFKPSKTLIGVLNNKEEDNGGR